MTGRATEALVAELRVKFVDPSGKVTDGLIGVGMPTQNETEYSCTAVMLGLGPPCPVRGEDGLQALRLALQYLAWELHAFTEHGGRVLEQNEDLDLPTIFGRLWAPTPTPEPKLG